MAASSAAEAGGLLPVDRQPPLVIVGTFGLRTKGTMSARALPLAQELAERGWPVRLVIPPWDSPEDSGRVDSIGGVTVIQVALGGGPLAITRRMLAAARAAPRQPGQPWPPLIHCFKPKGYGGLVAMALAGAGWPLVVDNDDWESRGGWNDRVGFYGPVMRRVFDWQARRLPRQARLVTVASRTLETQVWGLGVVPARVVYVPNGVSRWRHAGWVTEATPASVARATRGLPEAPTLLLYTRFDVVTPARVMTLLAGVREWLPTARLLVVGAGPAGEERQLVALARAAGLAPALTVVGQAPFEDLPALLRCADAAMYPIDDTLIDRSKAPVKLLEVMALGVPVVAEAVGETVAYLGAGQAGLLVEAGDSNALARGAAHLLDCPGERAHLAEVGRARVWRNHTWERLTDRVEAAYAAALASVQWPSGERRGNG